jgi:hypothetical protein
MKTIFSIDGLSVIGKAVQHIRTTVKFFSVAGRTLLPALALLLMFSSCNKKQGTDSAHESKAGSLTKADSAKDSLNKPRVDIKVNKQYDEKGNVIAFDSTYSTYYSNFKGDTVKMDSLFRGFDRYFGNRHSPIFNNEFNDLFFRDSTWAPDFFHRDFFMKRYELNDRYMKNMMRRMDSVKNKYYREGMGITPRSSAATSPTSGSRSKK